MARAVGMSESSVRRIISSLIAKKYISKCTYKGRRGYTTAPSIAPTYISPGKMSPTPPIDKNDEIGAASGIFYTDIKPKYTYKTTGNKDIVRLTYEQYRKLLTLVDRETLHSYVCKLELLILNKGYRTFNPYKTIKKWILEDHAV